MLVWLRVIRESDKLGALFGYGELSSLQIEANRAMSKNPISPKNIPELPIA
jgi:hypothetical protein